MGTFTDYTGMMDVPENQCAKYAQQMLGRLHADGMMPADEVGLFGRRIRLLYPPELDEAGRSGAQTPLNEHGYGLKNALSYLCEGGEVWLLESRAKADFRQLCGYLEEKLAYTYAAILAEGRITIGVICREQNAPERYHQLEALEPLWEEDPVELPETAKNAFVEGDGGDHPPPPDREGLHGFGRAAVSEPRVSSVRVSLAGRTDAAEHR